MIHQTVSQRNNAPRQLETSRAAQPAANQCIPSASLRGGRSITTAITESIGQRKNAGPALTEEWKGGGSGGWSHKESHTVETPSGQSRN